MDDPYYEVEIFHNSVGLMRGTVWRVSGDQREQVGQVPSGLFIGRNAIIAEATRVARKHCLGRDIVRLDLAAG